MRRKVFYFDNIFVDKYYINDIDILDENNLTYIKDIDIDLEFDSIYSKLNNSKVYKINKYNQLIIISNIKDFKILSFYKNDPLKKITTHPLFYESSSKNFSLLIKTAVSKIKNLNEENVVYSNDYLVRAVIKKENDIVSLKYQDLDIKEFDYTNFDDLDSNNFWTYQDRIGISFFSSVEEALLEAKRSINNIIAKEEEEELYIEDKLLWNYSLSKFQSWLYQFKFVLIGIVIFVVPFTLFPILELAKWTLMLLIGACALFSLIVGGVALWLNDNIISYAITEKGIETCKGMIYDTKFDNIKNIKLRKNIFNKNLHSIKFKLYKGLAINYNFDNIENGIDVYNLLNNKINIKE